MVRYCRFGAKSSPWSNDAEMEKEADKVEE